MQPLITTLPKASPLLPSGKPDEELDEVVVVEPDEEEELEDDDELLDEVVEEMPPLEDELDDEVVCGFVNENAKLVVYCVLLKLYKIRVPLKLLLTIGVETVI